MLDLHAIRKNPAAAARALRQRGCGISLDDFLVLDKKMLAAQKILEEKRALRAAQSRQKPGAQERARLQKLSTDIKRREESVRKLQARHREIWLRLPNIAHASVPVGNDESANKELHYHGKPPKLASPREHFEIEAVRPFIDIARGARVSGARFYYLRGPVAQLERALMQYALDFITDAGFELLATPILVGEAALEGTGYFPNGRDEVYAVNPGKDDLYLIGTSEQAITAFHAGETLRAEHLPLKYTALTPCFRREAGAYGKDTRGILRVHQFNKVEMVVFSQPEKSWRMLDEMVRLTERFYRSLKIPFRLMTLCTGDLGFQSAKTIDAEGWFPGQNTYRELGSASNTTDFQSRRLGIRTQDSRGERNLVHTLNNTVAADRALLCILENYQQADGSVAVPKVLVPYAGFSKLLHKI